MMELQIAMLNHHHQSSIRRYISEVGHAAGYNVITSTLTGVQTSVTTGLSTAWDAIIVQMVIKVD